MENPSAVPAITPVPEPHAGPILLVEDQPLIRRAWADWLEGDGWSVLEASSVNEALAAAKTVPPAVVVCDVSLGVGKSGVWLSNQLLASPDFPQIVYATSHEQLPGDATLRQGVSAYLLKPFSRRALTSAVAAAEAAVLSRRRRISAEQAYRAEIVSRREHLYARIARLEPWERLDSSAIVARLNPFLLHHRETLVAGLAERAGARLGLLAHERLTLVRAVELRDLGKVVMPGALLDSARPLASFERQLLASYPTEGEAAIARCGFEEAASWVGAIGDRWDGLDRPAAEFTLGRGPSLTRVLAVFLALTEPRPYRTAFGNLDAVEHLRRGAGTLYGPAEVNALVEVLSAPRLLR